MGSGGGTTTTKAEFPPEFRPLAQAAVQQIMALQSALPLAQFASPHLTPTAGVAPFQQAAMNLLPQTLTPTAGLQSLATVGPSLAGTAQRSLEAGAPTAGANWALQQLAPGLAPMQASSTPVPSPTTVTPQPLGDPQAIQAALQRPIPQETPALGPIHAPTQLGGMSMQDLVGQSMNPFVQQAQQQIQQALAQLPSNFGIGGYWNPGWAPWMEGSPFSTSPVPGGIPLATFTPPTV